jgi:hypothetical protein
MHGSKHFLQLLLEIFVLGALVKLADEVTTNSKGIMGKLQCRSTEILDGHVSLIFLM